MSKYFKRWAVLLVALFATSVFAQDPTDPPADPPAEPSAGTIAFVADWPVYTKGDPPVMYVAGEGILQMIVLAPEILKLVLDAASGLDVKARAGEIKSFIETARPVGTADCSQQDARIATLTTQVLQLQDGVSALEADKSALETRADTAEGSARACAASMTAAKTRFDAVRAEIEAAAGGLREIAGRAVIEEATTQP